MSVSGFHTMLILSRCSCALCETIKFWLGHPTCPSRLSICQQVDSSIFRSVATNRSKSWKDTETHTDKHTHSVTHTDTQTNTHT